MNEFGVGKYNALFNTLADGVTYTEADGTGGETFGATDEIIVGIDNSKGSFVRPIARNAETGSTFQALPDDQYNITRADKAGFYGALEEGRVCLDSRYRRLLPRQRCVIGKITYLTDPQLRLGFFYLFLFPKELQMVYLEIRKKEYIMPKKKSISSKRKTTTSKAKATKVENMSQTHGKEEFAPSTLDQVWGDTGLSKYGTMDEDEYATQVRDMTKSELFCSRIQTRNYSD